MAGPTTNPRHNDPHISPLDRQRTSTRQEELWRLIYRNKLFVALVSLHQAQQLELTLAVFCLHLLEIEAFTLTLTILTGIASARIM